MKLLLTSDWQCSPQNLHLCQELVEQLLTVIKRQKIDTLIHLGDVKHAWNPIDQRVTNFLIDTSVMSNMPGTPSTNG
jgi:hypothetical protein